MQDEVLIKVEHASKKFCRSLKRALWYGAKDITGEVLGRNGSHDELRAGEFWAVNDVSFELRRGECLGLVGRNGAGKTTLLRMLNGLIKPDQGRITMRGRISALIALSAGFNPILTGRENIYVNASVLGLTKQETEGKIGEIIDFAEIGEFIDSPVQNYSSGMQVRLGFAVASTLNPDVLLLDEVLAVGDAAFRAKCYKRVDSVRQGAAIIFVSHSLEQLARICSRILVLDKGRTAVLGNLEEGLDAYKKLGESTADVRTILFDPLTKCEVKTPQTTLGYQDDATIDIAFETREAIEITPRIVLIDDFSRVSAEGNFGFNNLRPLALPKGASHYTLRISRLALQSGGYNVHINLFNKTGGMVGNAINCCRLQITGSTIGEVPHQARVAVVAGSPSLIQTGA
jgi:lipopolysaccharide transport system ATP-binding protein